MICQSRFNFRKQRVEEESSYFLMCVAILYVHRQFSVVKQWDGDYGFVAIFMRKIAPFLTCGFIFTGETYGYYRTLD